MTWHLARNRARAKCGAIGAWMVNMDYVGQTPPFADVCLSCVAFGGTR